MTNNLTRYLHLRPVTETGEISNPNGGITIGWKIKDDVMLFSFAFCSAKDHYNKKTGRKLVDERFEINDENLIKLTKDDFIEMIGDSLVPKFFVGDFELDFKLENISNTFIIRFLKNSFGHPNIREKF